MKKVYILVLFFNLFFLNYCFPQTSASQLQRAQEMLEKDEALRKRLREPQKTFIKDILVEGVTLLGEGEIEEIVSAFKKHWLNQKDILQVKTLLIEGYKEKGYEEQPVQILHRIKNKILIIQVKE